MRRLVLLCSLVGLLLVGDAMVADATSIPGRWVEGSFDSEAHARARAELHARLVAEQVVASLATPLEVVLTEEDRAGLHQATCDECRESSMRLRVGVAKPTGVVVDFDDLGVGRVAATQDGGQVWTLGVRSEGATALRLHLTDASLPEGVEVFVYTAGGEAFGPYVAEDLTDGWELWANATVGESAILQVRSTAGRSLGGTRFVVADVGVLGERFLVGVLQRPVVGKAFCPDLNATCVQNAECGSLPGAIQPAQSAVAGMLFVSGGWYYICSGGLLDNTGATVIPYFLTANHCISRASEASSLETYFNFTTACNGECYDPYGGSWTYRTVGSTVKASSSRTGDYTLLELGQVPSWGAHYLGWTSTAVAGTNGTDLYRISHPQGAPQAYSTHRVDTAATTCRSWPRGRWIYSRDTYGATEGGSSGSPVINGAGQVVGQLSGACGFNLNDVCDAASNATVDGAFAAYFAEVEPFLDPGSGGGTCGNPGDSCTSNSDCCSGSCKGKPGQKICK